MNSLPPMETRSARALPSLRFSFSPAPTTEEFAPSHRQTVLLGMSGGVDSAVAALLLQQQGYQVIGATLALWPGEQTPLHPLEESLACHPVAIERARVVARDLGLSHITIDASTLFAEEVVSYFINTYAAGNTPNPCAKCNARVKFRVLHTVAHQLGAHWLATGHYARLLGPDRALARAAHRDKDQSYVLAEVDPVLLRQTLFPLGTLCKSEVRAMASEAGLEVSETPESQEICFIPGNNHRRFLQTHLGERPGPILDLEGNQLSSHQGVYNYTVGQRRGLKVACGQPLYVVQVDATRAEVVVGPAEALGVQTVWLHGVTWHQPPPQMPAQAREELTFQYRSAGASVKAQLRSADGKCAPGFKDEQVAVVLLEPGRAVARGQTGVVYRDDLVVCAGTICATQSCANAPSLQRPRAD